MEECGLRIAKTLETNENRIRAKIVEKTDLEQNFLGSLERTIVLHGDGLDLAYWRKRMYPPLMLF